MDPPDLKKDHSYGDTEELCCGDCKVKCETTDIIAFKLTRNITFTRLLYQLLEFQPFVGILDTEMDMGVVDVRPARNLAKLSQIIGKFEYLHHIDVLDASLFKGKRRIDQNTELFFNLYLRLLYDGGITEYEDDSEYAPSGCVPFMTIPLFVIFL